MMTGGPIEGFKRGWALLPTLHGKVAHFWEQIDHETVEQVGAPRIGKTGRIRYFWSICGRTGRTTHQLPALRAGTMPLCKHCRRMNGRAKAA